MEYKHHATVCLKKLAENVKRARVLGFRQTKGHFAKRVGVPRIVIYRIEHADPTVSVLDVFAVLGAMEVLYQAMKFTDPSFLIDSRQPCIDPPPGFEELSVIKDEGNLA